MCAFEHQLRRRGTGSIRARRSARALATVTESVAAVLLGLPVTPPRASRAVRERLDGASVRLSRALAAGEDARATAIAQATGPRIRAYARAIGVAACG